MHEKRWQRRVRDRLYPTYEPYPSSLDIEGERYSPRPSEKSENRHDNIRNSSFEDFSDLPSDPCLPEWFCSEPVASNEDRCFRPLRILQSLFSGRSNFLHRSLDELDAARKEREVLTQCALEELDQDIEECEKYLAILKGILNNKDRRQHLERRLFLLKQERSGQKLMGWRDLLWLRREIRKLQRELDTLGKTSQNSQNREPPK
jgi:hypothetical protein